MLVLSRRKGEKIVFPAIGVRLELLRVQGNTVRLGIEAPQHIKILRDELSVNDDGTHGGDGPTEQGDAGMSHEMRNRLHTATLALELLKQQLKMGQAEHAESTVQNLLFEFASLDREARGEVPAAPDLRQPSMKTLLVEDDPNESALMAGFLRTNGFDVAEACDGVAALEYLSSNELPDVVLLDMLMPRYNGRETIDAIRQSAAFRELKVFAISGTSPAELGVEMGPRGVNRWFQKPVHPETLVREISHELASVA